LSTCGLILFILFFRIILEQLKSFEPIFILKNQEQHLFEDFYYKNLDKSCGISILSKILF